MALKSVIASAILAAATVLAAGGAANASCAAPSIRSGTYINVDQNTRSITRADIEFVCGSTRTRNPDGTITIRHGADPHFRVRLWGSCSPRDCDWGQTRGPLSGRDAFSARYDQGFAERRVNVRSLGGNRVSLSVRSTYRDGRAPRTFNDVLRLR